MERCCGEGFSRFKQWNVSASIRATQVAALTYYRGFSASKRVVCVFCDMNLVWLYVRCLCLTIWNISTLCCFSQPERHCIVVLALRNNNKFDLGLATVKGRPDTESPWVLSYSRKHAKKGPLRALPCYVTSTSSFHSQGQQTLKALRWLLPSIVPSSPLHTFAFSVKETTVDK